MPSQSCRFFHPMSMVIIIKSTNFQWATGINNSLEYKYLKMQCKLPWDAQILRTTLCSPWGWDLKFRVLFRNPAPEELCPYSDISRHWEIQSPDFSLFTLVNPSVQINTVTLYSHFSVREERKQPKLSTHLLFCSCRSHFQKCPLAVHSER